MQKDIGESLQRLLSLPYEEGKLLILTHDNPDPDSIASAAAMKYLLEQRRGADATAAYTGIIGRAENRAMMELLDLPVVPMNDIDFSEYLFIALLDAQPHTGNSAIPEGRGVDIVVDHHPLRPGTLQCRFFHVEEHVGASATLMTEYLHAAGLEIPSDLATALMYGIRSETQDLGRGTSERDLAAYQQLFVAGDVARLSLIAHPPITWRYVGALADALKAMTMSGGHVICPLGRVPEPDFVSEVADLGVRIEGTRWSFSFGEYDGRIYLSIRATHPDANAGEVMQRLLEGLGRGGGHSTRAGGRIELATAPKDRPSLERELVERFVALADASPAAALDQAVASGDA